MSSYFNKKDLIYTVYKEGSFSNAAKKMDMPQPSLSVMVKKIEDDLGQPLFDRTVKPLRLTAVGAEYIRVTEEMSRIEEDFENYIDSLNNMQIGSLNIGSNQLLSALVLPPHIADFMTKYPKIQLSITDANSTTLINGVMNGTIDVVIDNVTPDPEIFGMKYLHTEYLLLAVPSLLDHSGLTECRLTREDVLEGSHTEGVKPAPLSAFADVPFLLMNKENNTREHTDEIFRREGFKPQVLLEVDRLVNLYNYVRTGIAASIVSDTLIRVMRDKDVDMHFYCLSPEYSRRDIFVSWRKGRYFSKAMQLFTDTLDSSAFLIRKE